MFRYTSNRKYPPLLELGKGGTTFRPFILAVFLISALVFLTASSCGFLFSEITEKRYNKVMCYYIARNLTDKSADFNGKIISLRDFVNENVLSLHGYPNRLDTCAIEKLISGIGWCDQQARVFMQLARSIGITSRLLFLRLESGSSPHSIAEALTPYGRWIIVDLAYKLNLVNENGNFASQHDIKTCPSIIADNERVKLRAPLEERWADPAYLAIYSNPPRYVITKEGIKIDLLRIIPLWAIKPVVSIINKKYINQIEPSVKDIYEFKMIKARTYHVLGDYNESEKLYGEVIADSSNLSLARKAEFYKAILLKDQGEYKKAYDYITNVLKKYKVNPYRKFLFGLRARILIKMNKPYEAEKDLIEIKHDLEA